GLRKRLRKFRNKIKEKLKKIGQKIQGLLPKLA
nr:Chain A, CAP18 [Oryctolagus cuniculus]